MLPRTLSLKLSTISPGRNPRLLRPSDRHKFIGSRVDELTSRDVYRASKQEARHVQISFHCGAAWRWSPAKTAWAIERLATDQQAFIQYAYLRPIGAVKAFLFESTACPYRKSDPAGS